MSIRRLGLCAVSFCLLAACSPARGIQAVAPAPTATPDIAPSAHTTARFTITVPPKTATAANVRAPKYVSVNTQSVIVTLTSVNGTPFTGSSATFATNLSASNPACTTTVSGLVCTASAPSVPGNDSYTVVAYDTPQTSATPTTPVGNALSQATLNFTVVAGQTNTTSLVLNGIASSIVVAFPNDPHILGTQAAGYSIVGNQPYTFTITAQDATGATIVGPGSPTFTVQSASSAISIAQVNANMYTAQVKSVSTGMIQLTVTPSQGTAATVELTTVQELWVANFSANNVTAYIPGTGVSIAGDTIATGITRPFGLAVDATGNLWVSNDAIGNGTISAYVPGTNTAIPGDTITGLANPGGIAFDGTGNLWVPNFSNNCVQAYKPGTSTPIPTDTINGLNEPQAVAFDAAGDLWVANFGNSSVVAFGPSNMPMMADTINAGISGPTGLAFQSGGNIWVANITDNVAAAFTPGNPNSIETFTMGLNGPVGLAFDASGNLWVANQNSNSVAAFSPSTGTPTTIAPITTGLTTPQGIAFTP